MFDLIKQAMFTGLGLASMTAEKLDELGKDLSRHAKLSEAQANDFQAELSKKASQAKADLESEIDRRVEQVLQKLKVVRLDDFQALTGRVEWLEQQAAPRPE